MWREGGGENEWEESEERGRRMEQVETAKPCLSHEH